jgi:WD40 repeat protein
LRVCTAHPAAIHALTWLDENSFVTGCEGGTLIAHDMRSPSPSWSMSMDDVLQEYYRNDKAFSRSIYSLSSLTSPRGYTLAIGCSGGHVSVLQDERVIMDTPLHKDDVRSLCLDYELSPRPSSLNLFTTSYDHKVAMWTCKKTDEDLLQCRERCQMSNGHKDKVLTVLHFPPSGDLVTSGADGRLVYWMNT